MIKRRCRLYGRRYFSLRKCFIIVFLLISLNVSLSVILKQQHQPIEKSTTKPPAKVLIEKLKLLEIKSNYTYEDFTQWNRSLCSIQSDRRGPHQKILSLSIYGTTSKFSDNSMYSWEISILPFLEPLANEVKLLLPSWIIRVYIDFTGSTTFQRDFIYNFSNIDVCDINDIPLFGSSLLTFLPGKMWRFLPVFDPYVDYVLSRDLDSPIIKRETETLDIWVSDEQEKDFFYSARDHNEHGVPILGGLWGAATTRARHYLFDIFQLILVPPIARLYNGSGDQQFLSDFVWEKVKNNSLSFDSFFCETFHSRPFLSQRPKGNCFLGCIRPCCSNTTYNASIIYVKPCPIACRPKDHKDWTYC